MLKPIGSPLSGECFVESVSLNLAMTFGGWAQPSLSVLAGESHQGSLSFSQFSTLAQFKWQQEGRGQVDVVPTDNIPGKRLE
jgi:hypothetical protein